MFELECGVGGCGDSDFVTSTLRTDERRNEPVGPPWLLARAPMRNDDRVVSTVVGFY